MYNPTSTSAPFYTPPVCPGCGRCNTCGRGGQQALPTQPYQPYPYPSDPWSSPIDWRITSIGTMSKVSV